MELVEERLVVLRGLRFIIDLGVLMGCKDLIGREDVYIIEILGGG